MFLANLFNMRYLILFIALLIPSIAQAQVGITRTNIAIRGLDSVETCLSYKYVNNFHEKFLKTDSCRGVVLYNASFMFGAWFLDKKLKESNHKKLAKFQLISIAGSAFGIVYTTTHFHYRKK